MSLKNLIDDAAYEAGIEDFSSKEIDRLTRWFNRHYEALIEAHRFIYSYNVITDLTSVVSDNALYDYAYELPGSVLSVVSVKGTVEDVTFTHWRQAFKSGYCVRPGETDLRVEGADLKWVQYGGYLYSTGEVKKVLIKFLPDVTAVPSTMRRVLMLFIAAHIASYGEREPERARRLTLSFETALAGEQRRNTVPSDITTKTLASYLSKVGIIIGFGNTS